jgi:DNA helicase II / ATP-dependent DNA helicase PcrA
MAWDVELDKNSVTYKIAAATEKRIRVIAGPGTGKSFAMKRRVARLLEAKIPPKDILAVTFTRVAAEDLHRELQNLGVPGCEELSGQTLHSLAMRILSRQHVFQMLGRTPRPLNKFELNAMLADLHGAHGGKKVCRKLVQAYEAAWAQSQGDEPGFAKTEQEKSFSHDLLNWLKFHECMLIGEIIPYFVRYLKENPKAKEHTEYKQLLVDEYQDLNKAEQTAIAYLGNQGEVCIVGDDDQSIYGFKHAYPDGIREWKKLHPGCADFAMTDCYRCPTTIVKMANALISCNLNREKRKLTEIAAKGPGEVIITQQSNPDAEVKWIATKVKELLANKVHPSEIIILVQRKKAGRRILSALKDKDIPSKSYYDESQLDGETAQRRFALFKLLLNNQDRVALRYLVGVGAGTFRTGPYSKLRAYCEGSGDTPWQSLEKLSNGALSIKNTNTLVETFKELRATLDELSSKASDLDEFIDAMFPSDDLYIEELRELAIKVRENCNTPRELLEGMMDEVTQPDIPPAIEEVRVMSLHKSKGLSSPYVFIAACVQGVLPQIPDAGAPKAESDADLEEARRLFFVGITRVKADPKKERPGSLYITYPKEMNAGVASGEKVAFKHVVYGQAQLLPSIFIHELGPAAPNPI